MSCFGRLRHQDVETSFCPHCGERVNPDPIRIDSLTSVQDAAALLGVRPDWHEPDEQEVTAVVEGHTFDNAGFWPDEGHEDLAREHATEMCVKLFKEGRLVAVANLATLFALACRTHR